MNKILYISLTGMTQALGKSQVISYLKPLSKKNKIFLISFERSGEESQIELVKADLNNHGIDWRPLRYDNKFGILTTLIQIFICVTRGLPIVKKNKINVIHARSLIPGVMSYCLSVFTNAKFLFDIRDFFTDEKVDGGRIKKGSLIYKTLFNIEKFLYKKSNYIVALTHVSKDILVKKFKIKSNRVVVVPTCADANIFYPISENEKKDIRIKYSFSKNDFICIHVGTVTGWYLFDEELIFFKEIKKQNPYAKFLILNQGQHKFILEKLSKFSIDITDVVLLDIPFEEVNYLINIADVALYFIIPSYSKKAAAPTKFAEFVRVSLPSITNPGIGDMDNYILENKTGVLTDPYNISPDSVKKSLAGIENIICSEDKSNFFNLYNRAFTIEAAVKKYQQIYDELINE